MPYSTTYKLGGDLEVNRIGFGAMRITGPGVFGMPSNPQNSIDLVRRAVELGANFRTALSLVPKAGLSATARVPISISTQARSI